MSRKSFNIAQVLANYFVESKLILVIIPVVLAIGLAGLLMTPREENPQIAVPAAEVTVPAPGMTAQEIEHLILTPLENRLNAMVGVRHSYGLAVDGVAKVQVEFEVGEDPSDAFVRLYDQVLRYRTELPPLAGEPLVRVVDVDDVPFMVITLASAEHDRHALGRMAERMVEHLRSLDEVSHSEVIGALREEIRVEIDPARLQAFGLDLNQVKAQLQQADLNVPVGAQVYEGKLHHLRITRRLDSPDQVRNLVLRTEQPHVVRLQDVATITAALDTEHSNFARFHFGQADSRFATTAGQEMAAVHLAIAKREGANSVPLAETVLARVARMQADWLPSSVHVVTTRDDAKNANDSVNTLVEHLFVAIAVVSLVLWLFLGWRAALIVVLTIPLVFALVMGADLLAGPTLNRITLYALILALGMLVDDAIVVIENIHRHNQLLPANADRETYARTIVNAAAEIGNPTTLATVTIVIVFLSLLLVTGMLGEYFYPVAFNVPAAMIASLLIAYMVTPWAARRFLPVTRATHRENILQRSYRQIFTQLQRSRLLRHSFYLCILLAILGSLLQPVWQFVRPQGVGGSVSSLGVPLAFLPKDNKNTFLVTVQMPDFTPLENTDRLVRDIEAVLLNEPEVVNLQTFVGLPSVIDFNGQLRGSGANIGEQYAQIRVNLTDKSRRDLRSIDIVKQLRPKLDSLAQAHPEATMQLVEDPPGPPVKATVLAEIYGTDHTRREALAMQIEQAFRQTWDMAEVWTSVPDDISEFQFAIDQERAHLAGLSVPAVAEALQLALQGAEVNTLRSDESRLPIPLRLLLPYQQRVTPERLAQITLSNAQGELVPLSSVVDVVPGLKSRPILHKDAERVAYVGGELADSAPAYAVLALDRQLDGLVLNDASGAFGTLTTSNLGLLPEKPDTLEGFRLLWDGELRLTLDAFRDLGLAMGISILLIYFLLVAYYHSFSLPLLVMVSIPLAMIGVFPAHWAFDQTFSAPSMIGVIAVAGVVVRNSLLLVDFIQERTAQGIALKQAAVEAGTLRLIPILLTTLAIALGTAIIIPDPVMGGLALSLIFGAISSACLTVFVVPLLYVRMRKG